ncbi:MAG: HDOD domain-containing protein [Betaproteobacteria bacterium]|nr:HDOD domain-containing protein [Betaproteobacteria bacterium]
MEPRIEGIPLKPVNHIPPSQGLDDQAGKRAQFSFGALHIPPRPEVVSALMEEKAKAEPDFRRVAKLITADVGLSAAMIKSVNSAAFGLDRKVASVPQALQLLGLKQVTGIATALVLRNMSGGGSSASLERFWDSAEKVALICTRIAKRLHSISPDEAYSYGLFHNCGIPLLMQHFPAYKEALIAANSSEGLSFTACEEAAVGTSHAAVGYFLARSWNLPKELCQAILRHHELDVFDPGEADLGDHMLDFIGIGHLAEHVHHLSARSSEDVEWGKFESAVLKHFGLSDEDYQDILEEAQGLEKLNR